MRGKVATVMLAQQWLYLPQGSTYSTALIMTVATASPCLTAKVVMQTLRNPSGIEFVYQAGSERASEPHSH
jgi:hypothetical protein